MKKLILLLVPMLLVAPSAFANPPEALNKTITMTYGDFLKLRDAWQQEGASQAIFQQKEQEIAPVYRAIQAQLAPPPLPKPAHTMPEKPKK